MQKLHHSHAAKLTEEDLGQLIVLSESEDEHYDTYGHASANCQ